MQRVRFPHTGLVLCFIQVFSQARELAEESSIASVYKTRRTYIMVSLPLNPILHESTEVVSQTG